MESRRCVPAAEPLVACGAPAVLDLAITVVVQQQQQLCHNSRKTGANARKGRSEWRTGDSYDQPAAGPGAAFSTHNTTRDTQRGLHET
ncbi:hypothetical protein SVAN01_02154 [Stagonosporopsis vannaccii]|nr:hypothetical protein SVAN01_02154 [Stagonosporopsis vannaccii]